MASVIAYNGKVVVNQNPASLLLEVGAFRAFEGTIEELNNLPQDKRKAGMLTSILGGTEFYVLKTQPWTYTDADWEQVTITRKSIEIKFADREILAGTVDGVNAIFDMQFTPILGSEHIFLNGMLQESGLDYDYICTEKQITFNEAPPINSLIRCSYRYC
jgi:hypothetical protein